jgi:hypothetical protein
MGRSLTSDDRTSAILFPSDHVRKRAEPPAAWPARRAGSAEDAEDEVELRGGLVRWHEPHAAASTSIRTRAARDRQCRSTGVEERTLDRDRTPLEDVDPSAFPAHAHLDPDALALIGADNVGVRLVEEPWNLSRSPVESPLGREIHHRVSGRVLNQHDSRNAWPGSGIETGLRARGRRQRALTGRLPTYGAEHLRTIACQPVD